MRFSALSLSAQTAYAELFSQTQLHELQDALSGLAGAFHKRILKGREYWYFEYRDLGSKLRMVYVGPDGDRVRALITRFRENRRSRVLGIPARMAIAAGCAPVAPKHYRIIKRLAEYGFFRAGGLLVGTHAFLALGNMLGVRWSAGAATLDIDFAHAGNNVSLALPADVRIDVHSALESLELGLLPISQFDGKLGAQYRSASDRELRLDFLTSMTRDARPVVLPELNLALEPLKFMEFSLESPLQACVFGSLGACSVNLPAPERFAVHKLIVYGERPPNQRVKANKDLLQAASLVQYFLEQGQFDIFNSTWRDALSRGAGWRKRALQGRAALLRLALELDVASLWDAD